MLNNIKSIKTTIIPSGLYVGSLCIWIDFQNELSKIPVCLLSGITTYYDNISCEDFIKIFENCENETIVFNGGNIDFLKKVLPQLSQNNIIYLRCSETEYYKDILEFVNIIELNINGKCDENFKNQLLKHRDFFINLNIDHNFEVHDLIEYCEIISDFDNNIQLVLTPMDDISEEAIISLVSYGNEYIETRLIKN